MNPLTTVRGALTTGFVASILLALLIAPTTFHELGLARWLHIVTGITWIGLLYYFNLVQIPGLAAGRGGQGRPGRRGHHQVHRPDGRCSGSAGPRSPPGSRASGTWRARATWSAPSRSA